MNRRDLMAGIGAATLIPNVTWADAHAPAFLSAARHSDGSYHLCGLAEDGSVLFNLPIPDRGHAAAAHPERPEAVAFARRPGRFALVVDCVRGIEVARLTPPPNRHFYGHGVFSQDGSLLFTTENDLDTLEGRIGLWDARQGYARLGDVPSGGIGPHDVTLLPGSDTLVIANGGIATHPESGRTPLNLATMRSNLAYVDVDQGVRDIVELDDPLRMNSIRHLDVTPDGRVAAGLQWNGPDQEHPPLLMLHSPGARPQMLEAPQASHRQIQGYVGSIAFLDAGRLIAVTSPRGGLVQFFDATLGACISQAEVNDVCGLAVSRSGQALLTSGLGRVITLLGATPVHVETTRWAWDNHLVVV
ncbi:DUF1513 domain-containing protein [Gymnodinialimonas sp.]